MTESQHSTDRAPRRITVSLAATINCEATIALEFIPHHTEFYLSLALSQDQSPWTVTLIWGKPMVSHLLIIHKLSMLVNLIFHREVDCGTIHVLTEKYLHFGLVFFILIIPDHIRKPNCQAIVTGTEKTEQLYSFMIRVCFPNLM